MPRIIKKAAESPAPDDKSLPAPPVAPPVKVQAEDRVDSRKTGLTLERPKPQVESEAQVIYPSLKIVEYSTTSTNGPLFAEDWKTLLGSRLHSTVTPNPIDALFYTHH
jgi:hypothetical protein